MNEQDAIQACYTMNGLRFRPAGITDGKRRTKCSRFGGWLCDSGLLLTGKKACKWKWSKNVVTRYYVLLPGLQATQTRPCYASSFKIPKYALPSLHTFVAKYYFRVSVMSITEQCGILTRFVWSLYFQPRSVFQKSRSASIIGVGTCCNF